MTPSISALILAGGESRRMGQDKALLPLPNGESSQIPLLAHISHVAHTCSTRTYILTPWPERYAHYLSEADNAAVLLKENRQGTGPLVALSQGWSMILDDVQRQGKAPPDWLLVLACDLPGLDAATLQTWRTQLNQIPETAIAALPQHQNRWEPLCGFYHHRCLPTLRQAVQHNIRSFQQWLAHETVVPLNVNDSNMLQNCNTPTQWQHFLNQKNARNP